MKTPRKDATDMKGKRFGALVVLGFAGFERFPCGQYRRVWTVRCDCGATTKASGPRLASGTKTRCRACGRKAGAETQSVRLSSGETLVELARRTGLSLNTIHQRHHRGWPVERLGEPLHPPGRAP